jgi:hypothetical protein
MLDCTQVIKRFPLLETAISASLAGVTVDELVVKDEPPSVDFAT